MMKTFTLPEAHALLPEVRRREADLIVLRADLVELGAAARTGRLADIKALEARLHEHLEWFAAQGLQVKGFAPLLLDFPAVVGGTSVLLCWLEGETALRWYHLPEHGFMGRRPLADLPS